MGSETEGPDAAPAAAAELRNGDSEPCLLESGDGVFFSMPPASQRVDENAPELKRGAAVAPAVLGPAVGLAKGCARYSGFLGPGRQLHRAVGVLRLLLVVG